MVTKSYDKVLSLFCASDASYAFYVYRSSSCTTAYVSLQIAVANAKLTICPLGAQSVIDGDRDSSDSISKSSTAIIQRPEKYVLVTPSQSRSTNKANTSQIHLPPLLIPLCLSLL